MTFTSTDFMFAANAVGVGGGAMFLVCPDQMAHGFQESAKRHARFLEKQYPEIGHRKMLECVAKAVGFANWHAFNTLTSNILKEYAPPERGSRKQAPHSLFKNFVPALPLLIHVREEIPPSPEQVVGLTKLSDNLAKDLGDSHAIRSALAKFHGADNWDELLTRRPENAPSPLYTFQKSYEGNGVFKWSAACASLVEELDGYWQEYEERPRHEQVKARKFIASLMQKRPDFLEGWLAYATIEELEGNDVAAGEYYEEGVRGANALIPKGFKNEISWYELDNRFYHRLLYNQMRWCIENGPLEKATKLARKQLRQNKSDNLGVRLVLPLLLALTDNWKAAHTAIKKLSNPDQVQDTHVLLNIGMCYLLMNDFDKSLIYILRALFEFPALRPILLTAKTPNLREDRWHRGFIPDLQALWEHYVSVNVWRPDVQLDELLSVVLNDMAVLKAQQEADTLYRDTISALRSGKIDVLTPWYEGATQIAQQLVENHANRWKAALR